MSRVGHYNVILKSLIIVVTAVICLSIYDITSVTPLEDYDFSIYDTIPAFFLTTIVAFLIGAALLTFAPIERKDLISFGYFIISIPMVTFAFLPKIIGHYIEGRGDVLTHVGHITDILNTGHLSTYNFYPQDHIFAAITTMTCGQNIPDVLLIIPQFFFCTYILSFHILFKILFEEKRDIILADLLLLIPVTGSFLYWFAPYIQTLCLLPLSLYLIYRVNRNRAFIVACIVYLLNLVFFHPLSSIYLLILLSIYISLTMISRKKGVFIHNILRSTNLMRQTMSMVILVLILFFISNTNVLLLGRNIETLYDNIFMVDALQAQTQLQSYTTVLSYANVSFIEIITLVANTYGQYIIIALIYILYIGYIVLHRKRLLELNILLIKYLAFFILLMTLAIIQLVFSDRFDYSRFLRISIFFYPIIIVEAFGIIDDIIKKIIQKNNEPHIKKFITNVVILGVILSILYFSIFNAHLSPTLKFEGQHVTFNEFKGMESFFQFRDPSIGIYELGISPDRFYDGIFGLDKRKYETIDSSGAPLAHFGNGTYVQMSDHDDEYQYFLVTTLGRLFYEKIYPEYRDKWKFTNTDFSKLDIRERTHKVYVNQVLDVYLVQGE
jgi:hypothetical protein